DRSIWLRGPLCLIVETARESGQERLSFEKFFVEVDQREKADSFYRYGIHLLPER
ncbi:hypothetical protein ALC62_12494, partial [Cyphomyrmex costatus]